MNKRVLSGFLTIAILSFLLPVSKAEAAETAALNPADGKIVITATGYTQGGAGGETSCAGPYLISQTDSGTPSGNTVTITEYTSCHMTISGLNIAPAGRVPAICVEKGAALDLTLDGENTLSGGPGCAGIYVALGGSLTISGRGTLYATGGTTTKYTDTAVTNDSSKSIYACGGAGIGGNGFSFWESAAGASGIQTNMVSSPSFGTVKIEGGTVSAVGGLWLSGVGNVGAGAGIGAGGSSSNNGFLSNPAGGIEITGGMVTAAGGDSRASSLTGGGAGIGTGGVTGNTMFPYPSQVEIAISGGAVTAVGKADGASIGGGANSEGGVISITGGTVNAAGGYEIKDGQPSECWGGAGIGGGDNSGVTSISITGGTVTARAGGAAAGIGSGNDGFVGVADPETGAITFSAISIGGSADVAAYGGSGYGGYSSLGGAGIGAGQSYYNDAGCGRIAISGAAKVRAYAGANAQAVGTGSNFQGDQDISLSVSDTVTLWAQSQDTALPALLGGPASNAGALQYESTDSYLAFSTEEASRAAGYLSLPDGESADLSCAWEGGRLSIAGFEIAAAAPVGTVGSWAALCPVPRPPCTVTYHLNGGIGAADVDYGPFTVRQGDTVTVKEAPAKSGCTFIGWSDGTNIRRPGTELIVRENITLTAQWRASVVPDPLNGDDHFAYVVGYPDGTVRPGADISRAETAAIFFRLLKPQIREGNLTDDCAFADVKAGKWYSVPIATMAELGIVKGRTPETFAPDAPITRAEFAAICARFDTGSVETGSSFTDLSGHWAQAEIGRAASLGWVAGYPDGSFRPDSRITRAEAISMINRVLHRLPETEDDLLPGMRTWPDNKPGAWYYLAVQEAANSHDFLREDGVYESWTSLSPDPDWTENGLSTQ